MNTFRRWVRVFIIAAFFLWPVMALLEGGMSGAAAAAIEIVLVVLCAAGAVFFHRASEPDPDASTAPDTWEPDTWEM